MRSQEFAKAIGWACQLWMIFVLVSGCGAFGDLSETKDEVKETNEKMDTLVRNTSITVDEIRESNEHQKDLRKGVNEQIEQQKGFIENNETTEEILHETADKLDKVHQALLETNRNLVKLRDQGDENKSGIDTMIESLSATNARLDDLDISIRELLGSVDEEKVAKLFSTLEKAGELVENQEKENVLRISRAMVVFESLEDYELPSRWYEAFFVARLETCDHDALNGLGRICRSVFHPPVESKLLEPQVWEDRLIPETWKDKVRSFAAGLPKWVLERTAVGKLRTNAVWAMALDENAVGAIEENLLDPQTSALIPLVKDFLVFARDVLLDSLRGANLMVVDRQPQLYEIQEFHRRALATVRILDIEDISHQEKMEELLDLRDAFLKKIDIHELESEAAVSMIEDLEAI